MHFFMGMLLYKQGDNYMQTLILSSSFKTYNKDNEGNRVPRIIDNVNGFLDNLKKLLTKRKCMVVILGDPKRTRKGDPEFITKESFKMSGISFDEYVFVDESNMQNIKEYVKKADCINLFGGHLPTANTFINELNLKEHIQDYDGLIIGASGGAMNMADNVYCIPEVEGEHVDKSFKRILKGLALTDVSIIPHYQFFENFVFGDGVRMMEDVILADSYKNSLIGLVDGSYIIQNGNKIEIFGEAYLVENGKIEMINKKDSVVELKVGEK